MTAVSASAIRASDVGSGGRLLPRWTTADIVAVTVLAAFAFFTNLATVLNNAYIFGSTLHDSTFFQTIIWRSGWSLMPAPAIDDVSFLNVHLSLINYLPNWLSYFVPTDRMTWYGTVYGVVYAGLITVAFAIFRRFFAGSTIAAALAAAVFYLSGLVMSGQWEPHQEIASVLFTALFFLAWAKERRGLAIAALLLNAAVREDCGLLLALPLFLLAALEWIATRRRSERRLPPHALGYAILSAGLSVAAFAVQKTFFTARDSFSNFYYGPDPFSHLSSDLLVDRLGQIATDAQYIWLPGVVLIAAAIIRRDARLAVGWLAFTPYWLFNFLSKEDFNAVLGSYKSFPLILALLWPAIVALSSRTAVNLRAMRLVQVAVLAAGVVTFTGGQLHLDAPDGAGWRLSRWLLHPETENAETYREVEAHLDLNELGKTSGTVGVIALYPYTFDIWWRSSIEFLEPEQAPDYDSFFWFDNDRSQGRVAAWLNAGQFPYYYRVVGTKISLATRWELRFLPTLAPMLVPRAPP